MSHGAHYAKEIPLEMQKRVAEYGHGLLADWVPQQALLEHPVSKLVHLITYVLAIRTKNFILGDGMVISHGGHNSVLETINAGIPT